MNRLLLEGETLDHEEIERRAKPDGQLTVYPNDILRVNDSCEANMGIWAGKTLTWHCHSNRTDASVYYGDSKTTTVSTNFSVGFSYVPKNVRSAFGECLPLACIKTEARQALEALRERLDRA